MVKDEKKKTPRFLRVAMLVLLSLVLLVPLATMNLDPDAVSELDNKVLEPYPTRNGEEYVTTQTTRFFSDRIGLRAEMMAGYSVLNDTLFHVMTHPLYEYGKEGQLFFWFEEYKSDLDYLELYTDYLAEMQAYCIERGSTFLFVITPEKGRVFSEYLPDTINVEKTIADDLIPLLEKKHINYLDLADVLIANRDKYEVFHTTYNAGHWSDTGAFLGIQEVMRHLQQEYPNLYVPLFEDYIAIPEIYTTLPVSNFPIYEEGTTYELKDASWAPILQEGYSEQVIRSADYTAFRRYVNPNRPDAPILLAFTGSYFNSQDHVTNQAFSTSTYVHNYYNITNLAYYYNLFDPDIVLVDSADYTIWSQYFPTELLQNGNTPAPYSVYEHLPVTTLSNALAPTVFIEGEYDAFGVMTSEGPNVIGTITVVQPDASGEAKLQYEAGSLISNYVFTWAGPPIGEIYALVNGKSYDGLLTGNLIEFGFLTEDLKKADNITLVGIDKERTTQYQIILSF
jgi:hypothetical protein